MRKTAGKAVAIAADSEEGSAAISPGGLKLPMARPHLRRAAPASERDLLLAESRCTDLVGREADLTALDAWRATAAPIAMRCLIGHAGSGKTRLAIELCGRAAASGWTAGFVPREDLEQFLAHPGAGAWRWGGPTLLVLDPAAALAPMLRPWLEAMAQRRPRPEDGRLRLLLLERHAEPDTGWWADLIRPTAMGNSSLDGTSLGSGELGSGGLGDRGPGALAHQREPLALPGLERPEDLRALLQQAVSLAAELSGTPAPRVPPPGADAAFDRDLAGAWRGAEPRLLIMVGLLALTTGLPQALALGSGPRRFDRDRHAHALAVAEDALAISRALASRRSDVYRTDVAMALRGLADCLEACGNMAAALDATVEALRVGATLSGVAPNAFAGQLAAVSREYVERCDRAAQPADMELLRSVTIAYQVFQARRDDAGP